MRGRLALSIGVAVVAVVGVVAGQSVPPPIVPPVSPPTTTTVGPSRPISPRPAGAPARADAAVITGQVVDGTGRGVQKAAVRLIGDNVIETVLTDDRGRFFFKSIPAGEAVVTAQKFGFFDGAYGKRRSSGLPLQFTLGTGQIITDMRIELFRSAVITGSVVDEAGEPIVGARVVAMRRRFAAGEFDYVQAGSDVTDDEGMYRVFGLQPGEYIVSTPATSFSVPVSMLEAVAATGSAGGAISELIGGLPGETGQDRARFLDARARVTSDGRNLVWTTAATPPDDDGREGIYSTQFYPATDQRILALPVLITPGDVRYTVNFKLPLVPSRRVIGRLIVEPGASAANQMVRLVPVGSEPVAGDDTATTVSEADGTFVFPRVPRGIYRLEAGTWASLPQAELTRDGQVNLTPAGLTPGRLWARADLSVDDADVDVLDVLMRNTTGISGEVVLERPSGSGDNVNAPNRLTITIAPASPGLSRATTLKLTGASAFSASNFIPGEYAVSVSGLPAGWSLKSITAGGHDALDNPVVVGDDGASLTVTLTTSGTEIIGTVRNSKMLAAAGVTIVILPVTTTGSAVWAPNRTREVRASANGIFFVFGLPPGDYLAVAMDDAVAEGWQDPRVIATLRTQATRFALKDAETKLLQLRVK